MKASVRMVKASTRRQRAYDRRYRLKVDRAAQWVKAKLIEAIHENTYGPNYPVPFCAECAHLGSKTNPLCPDHIEGKQWHVRSANQVVRLLRYIAEFQAGVPLRVLCKKCNEKDGAQQRARGHRVQHHSKVPLPSAPKKTSIAELQRMPTGIDLGIEQTLALFDAVDDSLEALSGI